MRKIKNDKKSVARFSKDMMHKLVLNIHRPHWNLSTFAVLMNRVVEEVEELDAEVERIISTNYEMGKKKEVLYKVINEAADVANCAMFLADNAHEQIAKMEELEALLLETK